MFDYRTSRAGAHAHAFLHDWRGHLIVDDYVGYKALFSDDPTELACLAHIRRKFFDVHAASGNPVAEAALRRIAALYAIEQQSAGLDPPHRLALRQRLSVPALDDLHAWLLMTRRTIATGCSTAKAIDHALKRWPALARYADSGSLPIDNDPVENAIRPIAIGKKNWLFTGSERAGRRPAAIQSLFATAKLNGLDPLRWLPAYWNVSRRALTARSISCCHFRTLRSSKTAEQVGWLDAYRYVAGGRRRMCGRAPGASADSAADWTETLDAYEGNEAISLMTIHKSKGLEYHTVIFVGLDDGAWWSYPRDEAEATAGFFVAFTRAKQRVIFTYSPSRGNRDSIQPLYALLAEAGISTIQVG